MIITAWQLALIITGGMFLGAFLMLWLLRDTECGDCAERDREIAKKLMRGEI